jgi:integrase
MFPASQTTAPTTVNLTVQRRRSRRYLTEKEIERLMDCARKHGRYGHRDATMILVAYRHGLRASEVCDLQWHQIELSEGACMSIASRTGHRACIRSGVTKCEPYGSCGGSTRQTPTYSFLSAVGR